MKLRNLKIFSWGLVAAVTTLALTVWLQENLDGKGVTTYDVFPLLGLLAFSIMWTHYIAGSIRRLYGIEARENRVYLKYSSTAVLALILLHPGLLIFQLYQDGFGLPPKSYLTVYGETGMKIAILLGTIGFIIFLSYELRKKFYKKSWWKYINWAQVVAMFLIFYHGLTLGGELSVAWYRVVWFLYGVSFLSAISYNYWYDRKVRLKKEAV